VFVALLPNVDRAVIARSKLEEYLLNPAHRRGASKARLLLAMGYRAQDWKQLEAHIREQHLTVEVASTTQTDYGPRFEIVAPLQGPLGKLVTFRSIWQIDIGTDAPRLITMHPE
jgi:hypothetical protein